MMRWIRVTRTAAACLLAAVLLAACAGGQEPTAAPGGARAAAQQAAKPGAGAAKPDASPAAAQQGAAAAAGPVRKSASGYPAKPIELIVPFGAGGANDQAARWLATYFQARWGVPISVVNLPGGGGVIGTLRVYRAAPDGYTMLVESHATAALMAAANTELPFDWRKRTWIARSNLDPVFYFVKNDSPWNSLDEAVAAAKADPNAFSWSSAGPSAIGTWSMGQLLVSQGVDPTDTNNVSFSSGAESITAVAGGQVRMGAQQYSEVKPQVAAGLIKLLASVSAERAPDFPDIPTAGELGYRDLTMTGWQGICGPPGLPADVTQFWIEELERATQDPEFRQRAGDIGKVVALLTGADFERWIAEQYEDALPLAEAMGIRY
jgi:tripartite-type tricarboxylate transporter receptor subunit TctC